MVRAFVNNVDSYTGKTLSKVLTNTITVSYGIHSATRYSIVQHLAEVMSQTHHKSLSFLSSSMK